jgi:hypothetical protein
MEIKYLASPRETLAVVNFRWLDRGMMQCNCDVENTRVQTLIILKSNPKLLKGIGLRITSTKSILIRGSSLASLAICLREKGQNPREARRG